MCKWNEYLTLDTGLIHLHQSVLATSFFNPPSMIPFSSVILVDPPMYSREMVDRQTEIYKLVEATTPLRRDIWPTQEAARTWLQARPPWGTWDPRVLDVYTVSAPTTYLGPPKTHICHFRSMASAHYQPPTTRTRTMVSHLRPIRKMNIVLFWALNTPLTHCIA